MTWPIGKLDSVRFDSSLDVKNFEKLQRRERPGRLVDRDTFPRAPRLASRRVHAEGFARNA